MSHLTHPKAQLSGQLRSHRLIALAGTSSAGARSAPESLLLLWKTRCLRAVDQALASDDMEASRVRRPSLPVVAQSGSPLSGWIRLRLSLARAVGACFDCLGTVTIRRPSGRGSRGR